MILGAFKDATFEQGVTRLDPDDLLVLVSDGVMEALDPSGTEFGEERLLSYARSNRHLPPPPFVERLLEVIQAFTRAVCTCL